MTVRLGVGLYAAAELTSAVLAVRTLTPEGLEVDDDTYNAIYWMFLGGVGALVALTAAFLWFTYKGRNWARWGLTCLFVLGLILTVWMVASGGAVELVDLLNLLYALALGLLFARSSHGWFVVTPRATPGSA